MAEPDRTVKTTHNSFTLSVRIEISRSDLSAKYSDHKNVIDECTDNSCKVSRLYSHQGSSYLCKSECYRY